MQGIFVKDDKGAMVRPKSKKEVKEKIASNPLRVLAEATSYFGNEYEGPITKTAVEMYGDIRFVGPNPHTKRNFYGVITINKKGELHVK